MISLKRIFYFIGLCLIQMGDGYVMLSSTTLLIPLLVSQLKLPVEYANLVFGTGIGFVSFIVQPFLGTISDNCTSKFGRRKPFLFLGTILSAIGMGLMGESPRIGILLGDTEIDSSQSDSSLSISGNEMETISLHVYGLIVALIGTLVAIIGHSFLIVTAKALVSDIVVMEEQPAAQLVGVMMLRLNDLVYYLFAALLSQSKYFYDIVYGIGIVIVVISAIVTLCVAKEEQWKTKTSCGKQMISIGSAIKHCPKKMIILFAITFVFFIGMGPYLMNINNFVGVNLFHGNSLENDDKYNKGIQMSLYSLALASFIAAICSFVFPLILHGKEMIFHISGIFFLMIAMLGDRKSVV